MKIRIEHTSNPLNYGTNMMVTNFMYYLDKEMGRKNSYYIDVTNDNDLLNSSINIAVFDASDTIEIMMRGEHNIIRNASKEFTNNDVLW